MPRGGRPNKDGYKHGGTLNGKKSPEYKAWQAMRDRCNNPNNDRYADWGGRGIKVCPRWDDFAVFLADIGPRPSPDMSIERVENDRGYEPGNVRWATSAEQMINRRNTRFVERNGEAVALATLAKLHGLPANTLRARIVAGWNVDEALIAPIRSKVPNGQGPNYRR